MTPDQAWQQFLELAEQSVPTGEELRQPQLKWLRSNRMVLLGRWQVQGKRNSTTVLTRLSV
jgi:hypothetical protein